MLLTVAVVCLMSVVCHVHGHSRWAKAGGSNTELNTHSGSLLISKMEVPKTDQNAINVTFLRFRELGASGDPIHNHCYDFTSSKLRGAHYSFVENANGGEFDVDGDKVEVARSEYKYKVSGPASEPCGTVGVTKEAKILSGYSLNLKTGDVLYEFKIDQWQFCNTCWSMGMMKTGVWLELKLKINGAQAFQKTPMDSSTSHLSHYDMGADGRVFMAKQFTTNGVKKDFPTGYPLVEGGGEITFRFGKDDVNNTKIFLVFRPSEPLARPTEAPATTCPPPKKPDPDTGVIESEHKFDFNIHVMAHMPHTDVGPTFTPPKVLICVFLALSGCIRYLV